MKALAFISANSKAFLLGSAMLAVLILSPLVSSALMKDITLIVDGESIALRTHARTVAAALKDGGVEFAADDRVSAELDSRLQDGDTIELRRARLVLVDEDDRASWVFTAHDDPLAILEEAGISQGAGDWLWVDGERYEQGATYAPSQLRLRHAVPLTLEIDGEQQVLHSAAPTLAEALWENGIELFEGDVLTPAADGPTASHLAISLRRSRAVTIEVDGQVIEARVVADSVGEALDAAGLTLVGKDYAVPGIREALPEGGLLQVVRVNEQVMMVEEPIPFGSYYQASPDIEIDNTEVVSMGSYGLRASRVRVRWENGVEAARTVENEWVVREPEPRILGYGTKIVIRTLDTPGGPIEYWRAVQMFATSYSPCGHGAGPTVCIYITRSGLPVAHGTVALLPEWYEYMAFNQVYVAGYGVGTVGDTGWGFRDGRYWIDLAYEDHDYVPWARYVTVYFLTPVPSTIMWVLN